MAVALAVGVTDKGQVMYDMWHVAHDTWHNPHMIYDTTHTWHKTHDEKYIKKPYSFHFHFFFIFFYWCFYLHTATDSLSTLCRIITQSESSNSCGYFFLSPCKRTFLCGQLLLDHFLGSNCSPSPSPFFFGGGGVADGNNLGGGRLEGVCSPPPLLLGLGWDVLEGLRRVEKGWNNCALLVTVSLLVCL